jgi:flagellar basal body rod protein FlgG
VKTFSRGEPGTVNQTEDEVRFQVLFTKEWPRFQKVVPTCAYRIEGPFTVATSEGDLTCQDGYLCIDARGYPYPVAKDEFDLIYEPVA